MWGFCNVRRCVRGYLICVSIMCFVISAWVNVSFFNVWVCVCLGFLLLFYLFVLESVNVGMCGFFNVCV